MGAKHVCFACRKAVNVPDGATDPLRCTNCTAELVVLPNRFRPPKQREEDQWATARYLVEHGYCYEHLAPNQFPGWATTKYGNYVQYPVNLWEGKEFVEQYGAFTSRRR
ncbi:hypothetical protein BXP70_26555 [Hymenobacter crusticola]|uniref:Uncharacterized protein n=1 Tax=Hymenobacter crusticola TaxID=1770526 RepID=A0A243W6E9_9BACT|nr:hypothetical protein BXP70_26555 [Hymenobacter crusticola]